MRHLVAAAFAAIALLPHATRADTTSALANALALEQGIDIAQTQQFLRKDHCATYVDPQVPWVVFSRICEPLFVEGDPLARPFVHSLPASIAVAGAINEGARLLGARSTACRVLLGAAVLFYPFVLERNARVIRATINVRF